MATQEETAAQTAALALTAASKAADAAERAATAAEKAANASEATKASVHEHAAIMTSTYQELSKGIEGVGVKVDHVQSEVTEIWRVIRGSSPPPADPRAEPVEPLDTLIRQATSRAEEANKRSSATGLELAALEGTMLRGFATLATDAKVRNAKQEEQAAILKQQSEHMGIGQPMWKFLSNRDRRDFVLRTLAAIGGILATIGAISHGCAEAAKAMHGGAETSQHEQRAEAPRIGQQTP